MNAADATDDATLKKPTGGLTDDTSEKEIRAEAFKKPPGKLSAAASNLNLSRSLFHPAD